MTLDFAIPFFYSHASTILPHYSENRVCHRHYPSFHPFHYQMASRRLVQQSRQIQQIGSARALRNSASYQPRDAIIARTGVRSESAFCRFLLQPTGEVADSGSVHRPKNFRSGVTCISSKTPRQADRELLTLIIHTCTNVVSFPRPPKHLGLY